MLRHVHTGSLILLIACVTGAFASTETWSGGDNNDHTWTANANWEGIGGASADDDLVFPPGGENKANTNDFAVNTRFHSISLTGNGYFIYGNQLRLVAGLTTDVPDGSPTLFWPDITLTTNETFSSIGTTNCRIMGTVNLAGHTLTLSGAAYHQFEGNFAGTGTIVKTGTGTATFSGTSDFSGFTQIDAGALEVNVIHGPVYLSGGTLSGEGTVTNGIDHLAPGGAIAPGHGGTDAGTLHVNGIVDLGVTSITYRVDLNGSSTSQYDRLIVTNGDVFIGSANLAVSLGFSPAAGQSFTIIQQIGGGTVFGTFAQGTNITVGAQTFGITYSASNVVLTASGPPIPFATTFFIQTNGAGLAVRGSNGTPSATISVLASSDMTQPLENWSIVATGACNGAGAFAIANGLVPAAQQQFLYLRSP